MGLYLNNELAKPGRKFAFKQLFFTVIVVLICSAVTYFVWGLSYARSFFIGGAISIIPNFVFAHKAFKYAGARASKQVMKSFYNGAKLKLGLTAILFALVLKFLVIIPLPFLIGFCLVLAMPLLTPFLLKYKL